MEDPKPVSLPQIPRTCNTCGFLGVQLDLQDGSANDLLVGVSAFRKEGGELFHGTHERVQCNAFPVCAFRARHLVSEIGAPHDAMGRTRVHDRLENNKRAKAFLERTDWTCESWFELIPGLSPQKHLEQLQMLKLEEMRQQWEAKQEETHRNWLGEQEQKHRDWLADQAEKDRKWKIDREEEQAKDQKRNEWVQLVLALASLALAILALGTVTPDAVVLKRMGWFQPVQTPILNPPVSDTPDVPVPASTAKPAQTASDSPGY
jgi:hypothetical protein